MDYRVLGSLEVLDDGGRRLALGGARQQAVLAVLLLKAGQTVALERLVNELWDEPPETAVKTIQVYVSRLRHELPEGAIESRPGGYTLVLDGGKLDLQAFEQRADEGRAALVAGDFKQSAELLRDALGLWRGPALAGLTSEALRREAEQLEELRLRVLEDRFEADLGCGREREIVPELQALVRQHPFRERPRGQLMVAFYRAGRQADALAFYRETRSLLAEELGLEPSEELQRLEHRMLTHDPKLDREVPSEVTPRTAPAPPTAAPREPVRGRRPATVVFADVVNSTALAERLDPESMHKLLDRYSDTCAAVIERHGGTAEKFIGDAIVGTFGLTELHEDDALRAVRAAVELRDAVAALSDELERTTGIKVAVKLGINSGDVFVGAGSRRETFATGDSINVAARLEQGAGANEILLGERTYRLIEGNVDAEALEPLAVKGRAAEVRAWRLLELFGEEAVPVRLMPFVGRGRQLSELREALQQTREERACRLCTIVGPAGIGKSRLARELVAEVGEAMTIAVGRCLSYGEGITYHPLIEIVKQLTGDDPDQRIAELIGAGEHAQLVARRMRGLVGLSDETAPAEETFWAVRRLFEGVAAERPVIIGFEDVHWAEPKLLDLIEYLVGFSVGVPLFILCLARPELLETRPSWAAAMGSRSVVVLEALSKTEARELVESLASGELESNDTARIVRTAEGNPLFLEQLVAAEAEGGETAILPPSIQAVLAARIASLDSAERKVLEHAAVEGRNFRWSSVSELLPEGDRETLGEHLMALMRRQLIQPDPSSVGGEDGFRFSHVLIQEAAYNGLPKELCAELHESFARWLRATADSEDEIIGYHLERAYRCRSQLGFAGDRERVLAHEATTRLDAAGRKAFVRGDPAACSILLERAASLLPSDDPHRLALLPTLGAALFEAGRPKDAGRVLAEAIERSAADELLASRARVEQQFVRLQAEPGGSINEAKRVVETSLRVFAHYGDDLGQCRAWYLRALIDWIVGRVAQADEAWRRGAEHARRAGDERELFEILDWRTSAAAVGPTHAQEGIELCLEIREQVRSSPVAVGYTLHPLGVLHAMRGELELARSLVKEGNAILDEVGQMYSAASAQLEAWVEMLAGDAGAAEASLRRAYERLKEMGSKALFATTAAMLGQVIYAQGRLEEAEQLCLVSQETAAVEDLSAQVIWRGVQAKILARRDIAGEAEALAREAVKLVAATDFLTYHGDALVDLAEVLRLSGRPADAAPAMRAAVELYERKGNVVSAEWARSRLESANSA